MHKYEFLIVLSKSAKLVVARTSSDSEENARRAVIHKYVATNTPIKKISRVYVTTTVTPQ